MKVNRKWRISERKKKKRRGRGRRIRGGRGRRNERGEKEGESDKSLLKWDLEVYL